jgi:RNA polymerase sigma-70 factor (ECF subfamily)
MELALLTAIQRLPGRQRAVLILRDVLGWTGPEAADLLETTVAAANSALQRARATIDAEIPAQTAVAPPSRQRELLRRYVDAWERADMDALIALLREDAVLEMPPECALAGARAAVDFMSERTYYTAVPQWANGRPALRLVAPDGQTHRTLVLFVEGERIARLVALPHMLRG